MTEPTDAEIESAWTEATGSSILPYPDDMLAFARAVLAKWGTPPAVAGEPVAWLSTDCIGERYLCFTKPKDSNPARPLVFGDTTSQPTQPQAGAVPLSDEQIHAIYDEVARREPYAGAASFAQLKPLTEASMALSDFRLVFRGTGFAALARARPKNGDALCPRR